ncbi:MAG: aspartate aminotransferase family protein, partial [Deltaproteobacteria bacterium]
NEVNNTAEVFLTHPSLRGKYTLRMAIGQRTTQERQVKKAWDIIVESSERLSRE